MIIDLDKLNAGTWFAMEEGGQVCIRVCSGEDRKAIQAAAVKERKQVVWHPKTHRPEMLREEVRDDKLFGELLYDFSIVDWQDLFDAHGNAIPCTKEMKLLLMEKHPQFFAFVADCIDKLTQVEATEAEAAEKN